MKYLKLITRAASIWMSRDFAYKGDFFIKIFALIIADMVGPLTAFFLYQSTWGIPGWSFEQFLLFQGTLIIVFGLARTFTSTFPWWTLNAINEGEFDQYLVKPYSALMYLLALTVDHYGLGEVLVGIILVVYSMVQLGIAIFSFSTLFYVLLIIAAVFVHLGASIMIASMGFIAVKSEALIHLFMRLTDFARYPLTVYGFGLRVFLTFLIPVAVSSFYPAEILLRGVSLKVLFYGFVPVIVFFAISLYIWKIAMRKYTSAGG